MDNSPKSNQSKSNQDQQALRQDFYKKVLFRLAEILKLLKEGESQGARHKFKINCEKLSQMGMEQKWKGWVKLAETAAVAIANLQSPYQTCGRLIVKEIKESAELILKGRIKDVRPSAALEKLGPLSEQKIAEIDLSCQELELSEETITRDLWSDESSTSKTKQKQQGESDFIEEVIAVVDQEEEGRSEVHSSEDKDVPDDLLTLFDQQFPDAPQEEKERGMSHLQDEDLSTIFAEEFMIEEEETPILSESVSSSTDNKDESSVEFNGGAKHDDFNPEDLEGLEDLENLFDAEFEEEEELSPSQINAYQSRKEPDLGIVSNFDMFESEPETSLEEDLDIFESEPETSLAEDLDIFESEPETSLAEDLDIFESEPESESIMAELESLENITAEKEKDSVVSQPNGQNAVSELEQLFDEFPTTETTSSEAREKDEFDLDMLSELDELESEIDEQPQVITFYLPIEELETLIDQPSDKMIEELETQIPFDTLEALIDQSAKESMLSQAPSAKANLKQTPSQEVSDDPFTDLENLLASAGQPSKQKASTPGVSKATPKKAAKANVFEQNMRVPIKQLDILNNLIGEMVVKRNSLEQDQDRLRQSLENLLSQVQNLSDLGGKMQDLYERSLLEGALLASSHHPTHTSGGNYNSDNDSSGDNKGLNALEMDRFSGFHLITQEMIELIVRVREAASDIQYVVDETDQLGRTMRQTTTQLQETINKSRMVPFAQNTDRFLRAVREISLKLNKQVDLKIEGREVLIDKMISENLSDPMTHLVNNAIAHGIESPQERQKKGKSSVGSITIRAFLQGNQTVISVADDGAGIDAQKVISKALQKGLISQEDAQNLSEQEIYDFLFNAGFSTKDQADVISGRGVGLDVVRTSLNEIRGSVVVDSKLGKGTTFTIRLPLTLSISKALCCINNNARLAFPINAVEDIITGYPVRDIQTNDKGQQSVKWRGTVLPFQPLNNLLSYNRQMTRGRIYAGQEQENISVIVLRSTGNLLGLQVDQVLENQQEEIVIKQIEGPIPKPPGIAGATVRGDGSVMPICDVLELFEIAQGKRSIDSNVWEKTFEEDSIELAAEMDTQPLVLLVDDSITVRELLSLSLIKAGYQVEQARDGQEAWDKLRSGLPCDLIFCDIEMPKMNGLELLSKLQEDEALASIPIAMLTSRGADKHRQLAGELGATAYLVKPCTDKDLMDTAAKMLEGQVLLPNSNKRSLTQETVIESQPEFESDADFEEFEIIEPQITDKDRKRLAKEAATMVNYRPIVLIVDDSVVVREMLSMTFEKAGYQVEQARDGKDAWEQLNTGLPCDLILCDIEMPKMNGFELLAKLHEDKKLSFIPVAMVTSRGAEKHRKIASELGAKAYFTKPYLEEELIKSAQRLIRGEVLLASPV